MRNKQALSVLLLLALLFVLPLSASADNGDFVEHRLLENLPLTVDGGAPVIVKTLHYGYGNNRYVSLRDFAAALSGTPRHFDVSIANNQILFTSGADYKAVGGEGKAFPETAPSGAPYVYTTWTLAPYSMQIDGQALRYLCFLGTNAASKQDCFMSATDLAILLDLNLDVSAAGMKLDTAAGFYVDLEALEEQGFFYEVHSALIGDASTGTVYAAWEPDLPVPIASTTKLMTFLVVMDAVTDGAVSLSDAVTLTEEAARLSRTEDGMITMDAGTVTNVTDLLYGMLLPSSNECALSLAIHVAGSEEAFVERTAQKAKILGLSEDTVFYNCHGLPCFTDNLAATKVQNRMSALDMFRLCAYILKTYPGITQITSLKSAVLESLNVTVNNSNPLLYNLPNVVGLKTGTTNMSGACLVSAMEAEDAAGQIHTLVAVEYGAEDSTIRTTLSEELLLYGLQRLREESGPPAPAAPVIPTDAEELIRTVLRNF